VGGGPRTSTTPWNTPSAFCSRCNSEWMNDMDDLAFPHVSAMIRGHPVHVDSAMAVAVGGWVCKVVVTARSHPLHPMLVWLAGEGTVTVNGKNYPCHHPRCSHRRCAADHLQVVLGGCPRCLPTWCWTGRGGTGSNAADLRNGSPHEAGPGVLRVSQPSRPRTQATPAIPDAESGHWHSPCQRSAGGIRPHATASSSLC
jgi:hypothetical protein